MVGGGGCVYGCGRECACAVWVCVEFALIVVLDGMAVGKAITCSAPVGIPVRKSCLANVPATVAQLLGQLVDHVLEDDGVDVLTHEVDQEPIAHVGFPDDHVDALALDSPIAHPEHESPNVGTEDDGGPINQDQEREEAYDEQPKPDEDVDLLVDNIERENTESVVLLDVARRPELVEGALGHAWEHVNHGIDPILLITIRE